MKFPFFKDRGLKETAVSDTMRLFTYKTLKKDDFVIEFGATGDEFYLILEGQCEILVPDQQSLDAFKSVNIELKHLQGQLDRNIKEYETFKVYRAQLEAKKLENENRPESLFDMGASRRYTKVI